MSENDAKLEKEKAKAEKKRLKAQIKAEKKAAKARQKAEKKEPQSIDQSTPSTSDKPAKSVELSFAVKFAETVRGVLFLIMAVSLVIAIILSDQGYIVTLEDIVQSLILAWVGKIILIAVAVGLFIWGLKTLRAIK